MQPRGSAAPRGLAVEKENGRVDIGKTLEAGLAGAVGGIAGGPIGMAAGLIAGIAPDLLSLLAPHLAGPQGEAVASAVIAAASAATNTEAPTPASVAALPADGKAALQVQLATLAMAAEKNRLDAEAQVFQATVSDVQAARGTSVAQMNVHSALAYGSSVVSMAIVGAFGCVTYAAFTGQVDASSSQYASILVGTIAAMATQVANYWLGSSAGSRSKDLSLANSVPVTPKPPA